MRGKPNMPAYWPDGNPGPDIEYGYNPVVTVTNATGSDKDKLYVLESNLRLIVIIPWVNGLSVQANGSFDKEFDSTRDSIHHGICIHGTESQKMRMEFLNCKRKRGLGCSSADRTLAGWTKTTFNAYATYEKTSATDITMKLMAGTESQSVLNDYLNAFRKNYVTSAIPQLFAGAADTYMTNDGWADQNAHQSYFGRLNYDFSRKYLAEVLMRYDGSYMFKPGKQFGFFPGVSLGWRISDEDFWKNSISFISDFKLRASWGQTGNDRIYYHGAN